MRGKALAKKGNLSAALSSFDQHSPSQTDTRSSSKTEADEPTAGVQQQAKANVPVQTRGGLPPCRQGKKALTGYFDPDVLKQLKVMAATEETTIQALLSEALNDFFKKHGKPHIA